MILAWLLLLTGLTISAVAIYYSVIGLAAIFSAAVIPIVVMGSSLEIAKLVCASWLKANWERAPALMKTYMTIAVVVLMLITSMGIFGFLSKAHSDQSLVSGDVISKIAIYDEKIKIQRDNIDSARKALIQMDSAVDQLMSRTTDERGAEKAAGLRRQQAKERTNLQNDISKAQKEITALNDLRAPIAAEVRKVEAEVGPLKYIAAFIYGETNEGILERAVTWVIITIIIVFDPLAVIMLLAAQMTFAWMREQKQQEHTPDPYVADVGEKPTEEELKDDLLPTYEEITPKTEPFIPSANTFWPFPSTIKVSDHEQRLWDQSVANVGKDETPIIEELEKDTDFQPAQAEVVVTVDSTEHKVDEPKFQILPELEEESKKKSYMIKQGEEQIVKTKE
jgi:hypothetical protein